MSIASLSPSQSEGTRKALSEEVLTEVLERGVDDVSVSALCLAVNISRPTFYSRYGNVDGLLAEVFIDRSSAWLDALTAETLDQSVEAVGLATIMASARRKPELAEVVQPIIAQWWADTTTRMPEGPLSWLIANRLGVLLTAELQPQVVETLAMDSLFFALMAERESTEPPALSSSLTLDPITLDDPVLDAAFSVIAFAGYHGTSMSRVARSIRVTTGALYPHFESSKMLVNEVYRQAQARVVESNAAIWRDLELTIENFGQFVLEGLGPSRSRWRALRLETLLAGDGFGEVRQVAKEALDQMAHNLDPVVEHAQVPEFARPAVRYVFHTLGVGFGVLHDVGLPVDAIDHLDVARAMAGAMAQLNR